MLKSISYTLAGEFYICHTRWTFFRTFEGTQTISPHTAFTSYWQFKIISKFVTTGSSKMYFSKQIISKLTLQFLFRTVFVESLLSGNRGQKTRIYFFTLEKVQVPSHCTCVGKILMASSFFYGIYDLRYFNWL